MDPRTVERLVEAFAPGEGEPVIEIGPGTGALTFPLLECGVRLLAVEIDPALASSLEARIEGRAEIVLGDALLLDLEQLAARVAGAGGKVRLIGNLPYNVATAILRRVLATSCFPSAQILVQDEVADRLIAGPGSSAYGPLAVLCACRGQARRLFRVGSAAFRPRPKVVSAAVHVDLAEGSSLPPERVAALEGLLHRGFAERRKTLVNNLVQGGFGREAVGALLEGLGHPPAARAETLPPSSWITLLDALA